MSGEKSENDGHELAERGEADGAKDESPSQEGNKEAPPPKVETKGGASPSRVRKLRIALLLLLGLVLLIILIIVLTVIAKRRGRESDESSMGITSQPDTTPARPTRKMPPHEFRSIPGDETSDLYSPNYPDKYPENTTYTWFISAPVGYSIKISFEVFGLEDEYDYLYIGSGRVQLKPGTMFQSLTGFQIPTDIFFRGNKIYFHLNSDPYEAHAGFWIKLTTIKGTDDGFTCPEGHTMCRYTRSCFVEEDRCDGKKNCADGTDEVGCECPDPWKERCNDGDCITRTQICNGLVACNDDELNCTFRCANGKKLRQEFVCDGFNDCLDNSDEEQDCECRDFQYTCNDGKCIHKNNRCNGVNDCSDGEDEENCVCESWQFECPGSNCIPGWLTCDGNDDCSDGSDEDNCPTCPGRYHLCSDHRCIAKSELCDGKKNCANSEDEQNCESTCRPDQVTCPDGTCAVNLTSCEVTSAAPTMKLTTSRATTIRPSTSMWITPGMATERMPMTSTKPTTTTEAPVICEDSGFACNNGQCIKKEWRCDVIKDCKEGEDEENCEPDEITDSCAAMEDSDRFVCDGRTDCPDESDENNCVCGIRPIFDANIIMGGPVQRGEWPWQAGIIRKRATPFCGGTLINRKWIITAAHCIWGLPDGKIYLGVTNWETGRDEGQIIPISQIHLHPNYTGDPTYQNDIGLLKLKEPATVNNYVRPACLPPRNYELPDGSYVTASGWGSMVENGDNPPELQAARLPKVPLEYCRNHFTLELLDNVVCAGYSNGFISTCFGDSGGPLVSFVNGSWYSIGTVSAGESCGGPYRPNIFTSTSRTLDYILDIVQNN